jgi:hypothetical protein
VLPFWVYEAHAACSGSIGSSIVIDGKSAYDPFSALPRNDRYYIGVKNTGGTACAFGLAFSAPSVPVKLGAAISYTLADSSGNTVLFPSPIGSPPSRLLATAQLSPDMSEYVPVTVFMDPGQLAGAGTYADPISISAHLFSIESGQYTLLKTVSVSVTYAVAQHLSINVAGSGMYTTLDFGDLSQGATRDVRIETRSNVEYRLLVHSSNGGKMALTPPVAHQSWFIPYTATLDGSPIDLTADTRSGSRNMSSLQGDGHSFSIAVGDISRKRAGLYKDVITISIVPN